MAGRDDRGDDYSDIHLTPAQHAYLAAVQNWLDNKDDSGEGLDQELRDVTLDDLLDEAHPTLRERVAERQTRGRRRPRR